MKKLLTLALLFPLPAFACGGTVVESTTIILLPAVLGLSAYILFRILSRQRHWNTPLPTKRLLVVGLVTIVIVCTMRLVAIELFSTCVTLL